MEARNCPRCHKMFSYIRSPLCPLCDREEEETFQKLKQYIEDNPLCSLKSLSEETGVSTKRITGFIRDGRLEISKGMHGEFKCDSCGRPILRGKFCDRCIVKINQNAADAFKKDVPDENRGARMHTTIKKKL